MCSTVAKRNLCKNKRQCLWLSHLTLDVHSMHLTLIYRIDLDGRDQPLNDRHHPFAYIAIYVEWKIKSVDFGLLMTKQALLV